MLTSSDDDERTYSRRYTDEGINVVALDRNNRGLFRARPERRLGTDRHSSPERPEGSRLASLAFGAVVLVAIGVAIARFVG